MAERLERVDVLRGVAALGVAAAHAVGLGRVLPIQADGASDLLILLGASGVWLFFAISGYLIGRPFVDALVRGTPLPDLRSYAVRRSLRIYPLATAAFLAYLAITGVAGVPRRVLLAQGLLLHNLVAGHQTGLLTVEWTLSLEVLFYAAVPVLAWLVRRATGARPVAAGALALGVVASAALSIAATAAFDLVHDPVRSIWLRTTLPAVWTLFCPGLLLALARHPLPRPWAAVLVDLPRRAVALPIAVAACAAGLLLDGWWRGGGLRAYLLGYDLQRPLFAVGYGLLLGWALARDAEAVGAPGPALRAAAHVGATSYSVYLLHPLLIDLLLRHPGAIPLAHGGVAAALVHIALVLVVTVPLAELSWRVVEEPSRQLALRLGRRPAAAVATT